MLLIPLYLTTPTNYETFKIKLKNAFAPLKNNVYLDVIHSSLNSNNKSLNLS